MELTRIKLAGFKSFVDPTTIEFKNKKRIAVIGPNGCGKSNVIDAVRWVLGESSAKQLRGDSMTDVIFNGSTGRKPVGQASVELVFDNSDGSLGGEYAAYAELSIKRVVNREAESHYYLNGVRCRRRDITHIFLGTGLGARSYSIIEQGMISRLIEAKPEELRIFLEETAGISKYKERRRETENRIRHTRENVERLNDLRDELERQQEKLKRQSESAAKFKIFREEEDLLHAQSLAVQWRDFNHHFNEESAALAVAQAHAEGIVAERTRLDSQWEQMRIQHDQLSDHLSQAQNQFYDIGSQVARLEQEVKHAKQRLQTLTQEHTTTLQSLGELREEQSSDEAHMIALQDRLSVLEPSLAEGASIYDAAASRLAEAEQTMHQWQKNWECLNHAFHTVSQKAHGEQTTITHLEQATFQANERIVKLNAQSAALSTDALDAQMAQSNDRVVQSQSRLESGQRLLEEAKGRIQSAKEDILASQQAVDEHKDNIQSTKAELAKQLALQEAALKGVHQSTTEWLKSRGFDSAKRLAQCLEVEPGYELAVETVLGDTLQAVCVSDLYSVRDQLKDFPEGDCCFLSNAESSQSEGRDSLIHKILKSPFDLSAWLGHVNIVETDAEAWALQPRLAPHESVITKTGLWIAKSWLRVSKKVVESTSVLTREKRIHDLSAILSSLDAALPSLSDALSMAHDALVDREMDRDDAQKSTNEAHRLWVEARAHLNSLQKELAQVAERRRLVEHELNDVTKLLSHNELRVKETRTSLEKHLDEMAALEQQKNEQSASKDRINQAYQEAKLHAKQSFDESQRIKIEWNTVQSSLQNALKNRERLTLQLEKMIQQADRLQSEMDQTATPIPSLESDCSRCLNLRSQADDALQAARASVDHCAHAMRDCELKRHEMEQSIQAAREKCEAMRLNLQTLKVRTETIVEQMSASAFILLDVVQALPVDVTAHSLESQLETVRERIKRLGAINLAAIEEYEATHERRAYLDAQLLDLTTALEALEAAIARIDKETRDRFKATFDKVNDNLRQLFPQVFNGGEAYLEMTGDNLLETGVTIMARPPGKRNSNIHLLSGGEKALTAMALVFSLFRLNPSPFCMLDEVDAPLDDTNVGRFCNLVKEMAKSVQFIFITHNKLTMEMAETMMGVTMKEAGVSRIVSVNIDEAVAMVEEPA